MSEPAERLSESLLAQRVRERMQALHTNPNRLSKAIGGRDTVRMILSGRSLRPRYETLMGLGRELKCDVSYLLGETDDPGGGGPPPREIPKNPAIAVVNGRVTLDIKANVSMGVAAQILALIEGDKA